ncbi:MAG: low specificity L-threonine aldolase [Hyphomicrobiales bacterium]|nr:MAG: low specificity L-threonine aldolase [Hyphomicrobiales bacterium]
MNFASDNWAGASDIVMAALAEHNSGAVPAYGDDPLTAAVEQQFCRLFERDVAVFFVATGTAANALALASVTPVGGVTFCHDSAHIRVDECGAPEFLGSGRLHPVGGAAGKMELDGLRRALAAYPPGGVHHGQACAVSLSQATEAGTAYPPAEIAAFAEVARERGMAVHMDGARFANAAVALDATPAELTWKAGVDILSFGGTKNGCWCAEAVVFFNPDQAAQFPYLRKRAGHLFSKSRFVAAQFNAYLGDDHWRDLATHANAQAHRLASGIAQTSSARLAWPTQSNELFVIVSADALAAVEAAGGHMHEWPGDVLADGELAENETLVRLVTSFRTTDDEVDRLLSLLGGA